MFSAMQIVRCTLLSCGVKRRIRAVGLIVVVEFNWCKSPAYVCSRAAGVVIGLFLVRPGRVGLF